MQERAALQGMAAAGSSVHVWLRVRQQGKLGGVAC